MAKRLICFIVVVTVLAANRMVVPHGSGGKNGDVTSVPSANSTTSLRWRARVSREANLSLSNDSNNNNDDKAKPVVAAPPARQNNCSRILTRLIDGVALIAIGSSIASLQMTRAWFMAISTAFIVFFGCLTVWQRRRSLSNATVRRSHEQLKQRVRSLQQQNERLCRQMTKLEQSFDRLDQITSQIRQGLLTDEDKRYDTAHLVATLSNYKAVKQQLETRLQWQAHDAVLRSVLESDDGRLTPQESERLIVKLQSIPGIEINERSLRGLLAMDADQEGENNKPLSGVLRLLRQVTADRDAPPKSRSRVFGFDAHAAAAINNKENGLETIGLRSTRLKG